MMSCAEVADNLDMHALGALDGKEATLVAEHLAICPPCRQAFERALRSVEMLALAAPAGQASTDLKDRILKAGRAERQGSQASSPLLRLLRSRLLWPTLSLATIVVALLAVWWAAGVQTQLDIQRRELAVLRTQLSQRDSLIAMMSAPAAVQRNLAGTGGTAMAAGRFYGDPTGMQAAFVAWNLPVLPTDKAYQLWLIDPDGRRTSGGVFRVGQDGLAVLLVRAPQPLSFYRGLGVTIEPAGGSPGPTGERVLAGTF